jgi:hypothetical protein
LGSGGAIIKEDLIVIAVGPIPNHISVVVDLGVRVGTIVVG